MDEEKNIPKVEEKNDDAKKITFNLSKKMIGLLLSCVAIFLLLLIKIITHFAYNGVLVGVFCIFIYGTAVAGVVMSFLVDKKFTNEFYFCVITLAVTLLAI